VLFARLKPPQAFTPARHSSETTSCSERTSGDFVIGISLPRIRLFPR